MYSTTQKNNPQSTSIPIQIPSSSSKEDLCEYGLKQNFFDPSKSSPPNDFLLNLHKRMNHYSSSSYTNIGNLQKIGEARK